LVKTHSQLVFVRTAIMFGLVLFPLIHASSAAAAEYYVAPNGSRTNNGSINSPLDLATALDRTSPARPGDTIWLRQGRYVGNFVSYLVGTAAAPIIVRQYPGERATIDANTSLRTTPALTVQGSDTWFWGFEVTDSNPVRIVTGGYNPPRSTSVWVIAPRIKLINMVIHDGEQGVGFFMAAVEGELYGNLIYNVGFDSDNRGHGHSMYVQNGDGTKRIVDNIMLNGFSFGIHAYTSAGRLDNIQMVGNTIFNHGILSLDGAKANLYMGGGDEPDFPLIENNNLYYSPFTSGGRNIDIKPACINGTIRGNYAAGGTAMAIYCYTTTVTGNFFAGRRYSYPESPYPSNTYLATRPTDLRVVVRPNRYEPGRANITIFNWALQRDVQVDLSGAGLPVGAAFEIRDAQNFFGTPVVSGTYNGSPVTIPMTGLHAVPPIGSVPLVPAHTAPEFGAFILVRRSGGTAPQPAPTASLSVSPTSITAGQSALLSWSTSGAASVTIDGGVGTVPASGTASVTPSTTTTYTLVASNPAGSTTRTASVTVQPAGGGPPPPGTPGKVTFVTLDTKTSGDWKGAYGADGYSLADDATALPAYARVTTTGQLHIWSKAPTDTRALQRVNGGRAAAMWWGEVAVVDVTISDGQTRRVALYMLDWEGGRTQLVEVLDAATNTVLDTRTITNFTQGQYVVWQVSGRVRFRLTRQGRFNAAYSAIFFDGASGGGGTPPTGSSAATFLRTDTTTQGNWKGVYGREGYNVALDASALPAYARLTSNGQPYLWNRDSTEIRAMQRATTGRVAGMLWGEELVVDVTITDGQAHQIAFYMLDWEGGRIQSIEVLDAATNRVFDARSVSNFSQGQYWVWQVSGGVRFRIKRLGRFNAAISGIFFN
jgi:hypothetical protein